MDKQQQLEGLWVKLKSANSKGNSRQLFQIVKSMTRKFQPRLQCIQSATGGNLTEVAQIADMWKMYCEDLYHDEEWKGIEQEYWQQEPPPLRSEVAHAIRQTASRKATGPDEVPAELFKAGGETVLDRMHRICVVIWETGEWPEEWTFSSFIPLRKKGDLKQCANYRTIARLPCKQDPSSDHTGKDPSEDRNGNLQTNRRDSDKQGGREQITNLRMLMHKAREHEQPLYMCFVDFMTAFDSISHDKVWVTMMDLGFPRHLIDLLAKLYRKQLAEVKVAGTLSEWFSVKKGV